MSRYPEIWGQMGSNTPNWPFLGLFWGSFLGSWVHVGLRPPSHYVGAFGEVGLGLRRWTSEGSGVDGVRWGQVGGHL